MFHLIQFTLLLVVVLTCLLVYRLFLLYRNQQFAGDAIPLTTMLKLAFKNEAGTQTAPKRPLSGDLSKRTELLKLAQIFASCQLLPLKMNQMVHPDDQQKHTWVEDAVACYLAGAVTRISLIKGCSESETDDVIEFILMKNLGMTHETAASYLDESYYVRAKDSYRSGLYQSGHNASGEWMRRKKVGTENSLITTITDWGLVA